jgi:hypothetical protein
MRGLSRITASFVLGAVLLLAPSASGPALARTSPGVRCDATAHYVRWIHMWSVKFTITNLRPHASTVHGRWSAKLGRERWMERDRVELDSGGSETFRHAASAPRGAEHTFRVLDCS